MDRESVASIELEDRHELAVWRDISHVWKEKLPRDVLSIIFHPRIQISPGLAATLVG